jgi:DNA-binding transcriptional ArsR family regulator
MLSRLVVISDQTRYAILRLLKDQELPAGEIALSFPNLTRPAISQHLRQLKASGLLWERREGTKRLYRLRRKGLYDIYKFLENF